MIMNQYLKEFLVLVDSTYTQCMSLVYDAPSKFITQSIEKFVERNCTMHGKFVSEDFRAITSFSYKGKVYPSLDTAPLLYTHSYAPKLPLHPDLQDEFDALLVTHEYYKELLETAKAYFKGLLMDAQHPLDLRHLLPDFVWNALPKQITRSIENTVYFENHPLTKERVTATCLKYEPYQDAVRELMLIRVI